MPQLAYHSLESAGIELFGFYWFPQDFLFRRMPLLPAMPFRLEIEALAWNTAGGRIRFRTDSRRIALRGVRYGQDVMDHMPATGSHGFDLYLGAPGKERFAGIASTVQGNGNDFEITLWQSKQHLGMQDVTIFFPLYEGIKRLEIGLEANAVLESPVPFGNDPRPIVIYGTSITQGGCASRPSLAWTNLLSLELHQDIYNFGFSGNGQGEPAVAQALAEIANPALYILDYEPNISEKLPETLPAFLDILRNAHPTTPILILNSYRFSPIHHQDFLSTNERFIQTEIARRENDGDQRLRFFEGNDTIQPFGPEGTVDGCHATDLGFYCITKNLARRVKNILTSTTPTRRSGKRTGRK